MPGCGKSTVGKVLAKQLGLDLLDTDDLIEAQENLT
ncbi:MAG: shikimate kinase, partial [Halieaceae bacterium]|nr:shikimate kinase [Halieaceae bacterium]